VKPLVWVGSSLDDVKTFPASARRDIGYQLYKVQTGLAPSDWKTIVGLGPGVQEIRVHAGNEYRVIYVAKLQNAVYVLHAFVKKTNRTTRGDLDLAAARLKQVPRERGTRP
jgi:phage-related protein